MSGNPKRYGSQETMCMDRGLGRGGGGAGGEETMETEGQRQLQALLKKQLDTKVSITQQLAQHREFTGARAQLSATARLHGVQELGQYRAALAADDQAEELLRAGLTPAQVQLKLSSQESSPASQLKLSSQESSPASQAKKPRLGMDPSAHAAQLQEINDAISKREQQLRQPDNYRRHGVSRHTMELERSLVLGDPSSKSLSTFLLQEKALTSADPNDPVNYLSDLLKEVEGRTSKTGDSTKKKSAAFHQKSDDVSESSRRAEVDRETVSKVSTLSNHGDELSDDENLAVAGCSEKDQSEDCIIGASLSVSSEVLSRTGPKVLTEPVKFIPMEEIVQHRLSMEDVKKLPKFEHYSPGDPSKVLYVKNLAPKVTELDLVSLFGRFERSSGEKIQYRLMTGRMKGQAFITLDSSETAGQALQLLLGYPFKGKPLIIQYGRQPPSGT